MAKKIGAFRDGLNAPTRGSLTKKKCILRIREVCYGGKNEISAT